MMLEEGKMLMAALIFVLSFAALIQFVVLQWRASLIRVAATSSESAVNSEAAYKLVKDKGFGDVAALHKICPNMGGAAPRLRSVRLYHGFLQFLAGLSAAEWVAQERKLCARYAAAALMQQVERNQALVTEVNSF